MTTLPPLPFSDLPTDQLGPPPLPHDQTPPPGPHPSLGHFETADVLGRGGYGMVLKAVDRKLQRTVAVKVLSAAAAADPEARKRFLREARAAAAVRHPNVVQVYAVEDGPRPYLVLEYLPGGSLQQRLDRAGRFAPADVARVAAQVARGLAAAHAHGLVHRDVKPANILLDAGPDLVVKVGDFGLVWAADDPGVSQAGSVVGTPYYMSPEQSRGEPVDHRSDLFALGTVMYLLATGLIPFAAPTTAGVLHRVGFTTPEPAHAVAPDVPRWLGLVIARLHAPDPADRFQSAAELADVLDDCCRELALTGGVVERPAPPAPVRRKRRPAVAAGAGLAAAAATAAVLLVANPFRTPAADRPAAEPPAPAADPNRFTNPVGMVFVRVPRGTARLGGTEGNPGPDVAVFADDFFLGQTEVTQAEWDRVMGPGGNPSRHGPTGERHGAVADLTPDQLARLPVDGVSWDDCQRFLTRLNEVAPEPGWAYRLPTGREWEYALRGGPQDVRVSSGFDFFTGEPSLTLTPDRANLSGGAGRPVPVGSYPPNRLGLYDMHGNVFEYGDDRLGGNGELRPLLGGWWVDEPLRCRATWRGLGNPDASYDGAGLRVARVPAE